MTTTMITKPLLAAKAPATLPFPLLASPKLDGIRCLVLPGGRVLTRSFKPIPNEHVRETLAELSGAEALDGELTVRGSFQAVTSAIMSRAGAPKFTYHVFDHVRDLAEPFDQRLTRLWGLQQERLLPAFVKAVRHTLVKTEQQLAEFEDRCLRLGYEGVCLRRPDGPYKCGRSTAKEAILLKLKRFADGEARVLAVEELRSNRNDAFQGELGQTKRSRLAQGLVRMGTLGALVVQDLETGVSFKVGMGPGLTVKRRAALWQRRRELPGLIIKYRCQPYGRKEKPRLPALLGFRDERDL